MNDEIKNLDSPQVEDSAPVEFKPTEEALAAAGAALIEMSLRSFSERHPELGKMINCPFCDRRHRSAIKCTQRFKILWIDEDVETGKFEYQYATVPLPGQTPTIKAILGAAAFAKKRKHPHPSRRNHQLIRLVRRLIPDEYTQEDLKDARELAQEMLGWNKKKTYGKHIPKQKKQEVANNAGSK